MGRVWYIKAVVKYIGSEKGFEGVNLISIIPPPPLWVSSPETALAEKQMIFEFRSIEVF